MNWYGNRHNEQFIFRKVSWDNWQEHETYDYITGGEIEYAIDAELKITGKFDFEGYEIPNPNDLIRVYYRFTNNGETEETPLATFFVSYASLTYLETIKGMKAQGSLDGLSVLSLLRNKIVGRPYTIKKGTNAIYAAQELVSECGLNVNMEPTVFVLTSDYTFDSSATYLEMVNYLLTTAGFAEAFTDEYGVVQLVSNKSIPKRRVVFTNDDNSIMYPELVQENNWQETPNVVKLLYNTDEACVLATARNVSGSRVSLENRGNREITYAEEVSSVGEGAVSTLLKKKAEDILLEKSCDIEYVQFEHAYVPMCIHDEVVVNYGDMEWVGVLDNFSIELEPAVKTTTRVKRSLSQDIIYTSSAVVYRGE